MSIVNFSIPKTLDERVRHVVKERGFSSRAEFFRMLAINYFDKKAEDDWRTREVPTIYLKGKAALALDKEYDEAMAEYKAGKTTRINSLADLDYCMQIDLTSKFKRQYKKIPRTTRDAAKEREKIFRANPFGSQLDTHKLHGRNKEFWAYSIDRSYRIKFAFLGGQQVLYLTIGTHDEVY